MENKDLLNSEPEDELEEDDDCACITLSDDSGNETHFEVLDYFEYNDKDYIVLIPYEEDDDEVIIFEVIHNGESDEFDEYNAIEDETLLYEIFEEFKKRNEDQFDFAD